MSRFVLYGRVVLEADDLDDALRLVGRHLIATAEGEEVEEDERRILPGTELECYEEVEDSDVKEG